jgi:hypothetical protein
MAERQIFLALCRKCRKYWDGTCFTSNIDEVTFLSHSTLVVSGLKVFFPSSKAFLHVVFYARSASSPNTPYSATCGLSTMQGS